MNILLTKNLSPDCIYSRHDNTNDLTREMDKYILFDIFPDNTYTWVYRDKIKSCYVMRFFGASRACARVDENDVITDIIIYDDMKSYKEEVKEAVKKFIGYKIVFDTEGSDKYDT